MSWTINRSQQTSFNIIGEQGEWIATVYGERHTQTLRMIHKAPDMLNLIKKLDSPQAVELVKYIETGRFG
ncbi:hypothetical protein P9597_09255 [Aneurinibacillus migulanus]|uniref:hypothetical protein n=1 Tax=Aneurinibacillus migulanus TaxID=47500 RepID=UPI002E23CF22|nr:hypothetical protein [Aneurinibacillus migulanus]